MRILVAGLAVLLLLGAAGVTATRFVPGRSAPVAAAAALSPYATVVFVLVLVVALLVLVVRRGRAGRLVPVVAVLALAGVVAHAVWLAPLFRADPVADGAARLRLLTANLEFGQADPRRLVADVRRERVQVLVLEELTPPELGELQAAGLPALLPHHVGTPAYGGAGTVVLSSLPLRQVGTVPVANTGVEVLVGTPGSGVGQVRLLGVHTAQPLQDANRWAEDLGTLRTAARRAVLRGPTVVAGDLNSTLDHQRLRRVLSVGLTDAVDGAGSGWQPTWPERFRWSWTRPLVTLDHVLTSDQLGAVETRTLALSGSDHRGLLVVLARR